MFAHIYLFEVKYWFRKTAFYIYAAIMFGLGLFIMAAAAGFFQGITASIDSLTVVNSPIAIFGILNEMTVIIYFMLPAIIGGTIEKDYSSEVHSVLYSYPFKKWEYLLAKFFSGLTIGLLVVVACALGMVLGSLIPGTNPDLLGPFNISNYLQPFIYYVIPNFIFFGSIVFGVVTFSRSISVGFIVMLVLVLIQIFAGTAFSDLDNKVIASLLDPTGLQANVYYTQYWTVYEQNENPLPLGPIIWYNRALWLTMSLLIFSGVYRLFNFSQQGWSLSDLRRKKGSSSTKKNFGSVLSIDLPKVNFDFSFLQNLKNAWYISTVDFRFILKSWAFIIISIVGLLISLSVILLGGEIFGTDTLPVTWQMLQLPGTFFGLFINILTFLYAGVLIHRSRNNNMDQLVHATATENWVIMLGKFIALIKMQFLLLSIILIAGVSVQVYNGYFKFELGQYLFQLYGINFVNVLIWGLLAFFVHSLFRNYYLGFFLLLLVSIGITFLDEIGVEQAIFRYNNGPGTSYSDMNGFGTTLGLYYIYKLYWLMLGIFFYILSVLFFRRGTGEGIKERLAMAKQRFNPVLMTITTVSLAAFIALGSWIWYTNNIRYERLSSKEQEARSAQWEKNYGKFNGIPQPRIVDSYIELDIYPDSRDMKVRGTYTLKNKTDVAIDSIHIDHNNYPSTFDFSKPYELVLEDDSMNYDIYRLGEALMPGDSLTFTFNIENKPNELLRNNSPILNNGTFINNGIFPRIGYNAGSELRGQEARERYGLPEKDRLPPPTDSTALGNTYISYDADWIQFETVISTKEGQTAIAPGYLQDNWTEDGRSYFHYKMDVPMLNFYSFISAEYEVVKDTWNDINLEIWYHEGHEYNLERMMKGIKKGLEYNTENFSPYQHKQVRIIEFPRTSGSFAQSFANTIPYSEAIGFIAEVDDEDKTGVDYPFSITAHEVAHQWFAHQVIGAAVQGATVMSESMSEYSSLKVLEKENGVEEMRVFLKDALDSYLQGRTLESQKEKALIYNENQGYIHYNKGSLVLYALSDYIGEENLNGAVRRYIDKVAFQEPPYTTSLEFLSYLDEVTPDSLKYLITDMFETITLYENRIDEATWDLNEDSTYTVELTVQTTKYRNTEEGQRIYSDAAGDSLSYLEEGRSRPILSLPLKDYIEVGVFGTDENEDEIVLYLEKLPFDSIKTTLTITVDGEPSEVGIDPYNKLIDANSNDNRRPVKRSDSTGD